MHSVLVSFNLDARRTNVNLPSYQYNAIFLNVPTTISPNNLGKERSAKSILASGGISVYIGILAATPPRLCSNSKSGYKRESSSILHIWSNTRNTISNWNHRGSKTERWVHNSISSNNSAFHIRCSIKIHIQLHNIHGYKNTIGNHSRISTTIIHTIQESS